MSDTTALVLIGLAIVVIVGGCAGVIYYLNSKIGGWE